MSKSKTAAFVAGVVGFAVLSVFAAPVAHAQSTADLQAQISALLAQIAQLQAMAGGSSMAAGSAPMAPLTVGSTGAEVSKLQSWLISKGYGIAAGATGTFGPQTKAALAAFQAANGISPAVGYYGSVTAAKVASMMGPSMPTTPTTPGTTPVLNGTDGSVTVSFNPFAPTSQTVKKGETKDIISVKLQATSGDVNVSRFDVNFSIRPWTVFTKLTLKDQNGNVLATKMINSAADATEVQVGSNYLVRFDGVNKVVTPGQDVIFVVAATASNDSDKITGQTIYTAVPTGSIRTINGRGYTDSVGLGATTQGGAVNSSYGNAVTLTSTGSTADLYTRISPSTPPQRIVTTTSGSQTPDVVLGVFSVKTLNRGATINALDVFLNTSNTDGVAKDAARTYSNVRLCDGSMCYGAQSVGTTTTFNNLTINVAEETWKDLTLKADVLAGVTNYSASSTLDASSVNGVDTNYNTLTVSNATDATSQKITYLTSGLSITNASASFSPVQTNNSTLGGTVTFQFTASNTGNNDVFISAVPATALSTSTSGSAGSPASASSTITTLTASPGVGWAGDTATLSAPTTGAYIIPAGSSRVFTYTGALDNKNGTAGIRVFRINSITFGSSAGTPTGSSINFGIENLVVNTYLSS